MIEVLIYARHRSLELRYELEIFIGELLIHVEMIEQSINYLQDYNISLFIFTNK